MNFSKYFKIFALLLTVGVFITSCTKENVDEVKEETIQDVIVFEDPAPIAAGMRIILNGDTVSYDNAFAAYCNDGAGTEYLQISNKAEFLGDTIDFTGVEVDDFLIYNFITPDGDFTVGGTVFEDTFMGYPITVLGFDAETELTISNQTADEVSGVATGILFSPDNGIIGDFTVDFIADIVQTSTFCD